MSTNDSGVQKIFQPAWNLPDPSHFDSHGCSINSTVARAMTFPQERKNSESPTIHGGWKRKDQNSIDPFGGSSQKCFIAQSGKELAKVKRIISELRKSCGVAEPEKSHHCSNCGGHNAVRDVVMARTPTAMEQAILDA